MMQSKVQYTECVHGDRSGNFDRYATSQATRQVLSKFKDSMGKVVETTIYYRGSRIVGKQTRDSFGYRYFLREACQITCEISE